MATSGGHEVKLDDGEKAVSVATSNGHEICMDDDGEKVAVATTSGHQVEMDDGGSKVTVASSGGHQVILDDQQNTVTIESSGGQSIKLDGNGGSVTIKADEVVLDGTMGVKLGGSAAMQPVVLGTAMMTLFNAHVHTSPFLGIPTSPPITPMTPAQISTKVKTV